MNYTKLLIILSLVFVVASCEMSSSSNNNNTNTTVETPTKNEETTVEKKDNWLIIPGEQVGRIKANFNSSDIYKTFGKDNIAETEIGLGEGETKKGLLVFPKTKNELQVLFEGNEKMEKIESIKIRGEGAMWKTQEGVQVGTTCEELVTLNGKDFKFLGFEWDYAGRLYSWEKGKMSDNLIVFLEPTNEEAIFPHLLGDKDFSTENPKAKEAGLKVTSMEITF